MKEAWLGMLFFCWMDIYFTWFVGAIGMCRLGLRWLIGLLAGVLGSLLSLLSVSVLMFLQPSSPLED